MNGRVLVIDDSTTLRKLVEIALRGTGCAVDFAATGAEGVARAQRTRPDVILLDYLLPDQRGTDVCRQLEAAAGTNSPVVIMSANQRTIMDEFREFPDVVDFVGKPFSAEEIRSKLSGAMQAGPATPRAQTPLPQTDASRELVLAGSLEAASLLDVLRLLTSQTATGTLVLRSDATYHVHIRRGEILMAVSSSIDWAALAHHVPGELPAAVRDQLKQGAAAGKPGLVSCLERGLVRLSNQPVVLHAEGQALLVRAAQFKQGRFEWQPSASLPSFVEAFGRHLSLTAVALALRGRVEPMGGSAHLDRVYQRSPNFSQKLGGVLLGQEEQRVLALIDGRSPAREIAFRAKLMPDRVSAILGRLATAELVRHEAASRVSTSRTLVVLDADRDGFVVPLRAWLSRHLYPISVVEVASAAQLASSVGQMRPDLVLIDEAQLTGELLARLREVAREGHGRIVVLRDELDPQLPTEALLQAGVHAIWGKPVHESHLESLLS